MFRWLWYGGERPAFAVNGAFTPSSGVSEQTLRYGSLSAQLRAIADEVEKLERAAISQVSGVESDVTPAFGQVQQERKVQEIEQAAGKQAAKRQKRQG